MTIRFTTRHRRFTREHVKIMGRRQFVSYEVAGGKSILRFLRYVTYPGIPAESFDCFKGIAPSNEPAAILIPGETYTVRATSGDHRSVWSRVGNGQKFIAIDEDFPGNGRRGRVRLRWDQNNGAAKGWTNRHVMFLQTNAITRAKAQSGNRKPTAIILPGISAAIFTAAARPSGAFDAARDI
jgi:hypothetical protein